jgi:hypothetical protein
MNTKQTFWVTMSALAILVGIGLSSCTSIGNGPAPAESGPKPMIQQYGIFDGSVVTSFSSPDGKMTTTIRESSPLVGQKALNYADMESSMPAQVNSEVKQWMKLGNGGFTVVEAQAIDKQHPTTGRIMLMGDMPMQAKADAPKQSATAPQTIHSTIEITYRR